MTPWRDPWPSSARSGDVDAIVLHSIAAPSVDEAMALLRRHRVSAHHVIDQAGNVYDLVPWDRAAWHAGGGRLPPEAGARPINDRSIGIELVVISAREATYSGAQLAALETLLRAAATHYPIAWIASHEAVDRRRRTPRQPPDHARSDPWRFGAYLWQRAHHAVRSGSPDARLDV